MKKWPAIVGAVVALGLVVVALFLYRDYRGGQDDNSARAAAVAAATTDAEAALSYSAATVSADLAKSETLLANPFKAQFQALVPTIAKSATQRHISTSAVVSAAGVVSMKSRSQVVVLLFVNQNTTSGSSLQPVQQGSRIQITMIKSGGRWLIADLKAI